MAPQRTPPTARAPSLILLLAALAASGCDSTSKEPAAPDLATSPEPGAGAHPLVGSWQTTGPHERLGEVDIVMTLEEDGTLRLLVGLPSGGSVSFPGTWEAEEQSLVLRGAFFTDEMSTVSWELTGSGSLILTDSTGATQDWSPVKS